MVLASRVLACRLRSVFHPEFYVKDLPWYLIDDLLRAERASASVELSETSVVQALFSVVKDHVVFL